MQGTNFRRLRSLALALGTSLILACGLPLPATANPIDLADAPLFASVAVPGNLALALSVEYPTATTPAYTTDYSASNSFLGYFDPKKCYRYVYDKANPEKSYFDPQGPANNHACAAATPQLQLWSGNYLNWASMQTLDTFRWVLTGGYRSVDTPNETILTKTYAWWDGSNADKTLSGGVSSVTPFTWPQASTRVRALGTSIYISANPGLLSANPSAGTTAFQAPAFQPQAGPPRAISPWLPQAIYNGGEWVVANAQCYRAKWWTRGNPPPATMPPMGSPQSYQIPWELVACPGPGGGGQPAMGGGGQPAVVAASGVVDYNGQFGTASTMAVYRLFINVRVCVPGPLSEDDCVPYGNHAKPEGLMQKYASKLRYAAFGYYNDSNGTPQRDGAILRARMKFIAPTQPQAGSKPVANSEAEWDAASGVMVGNPDAADAAATVADAARDGATVSITKSGVMNYLNQFGYTAHSYKTYDPVGELYYAVTRYFRNKGNVEAYSSLRGVGTANAATFLDGFPALRQWKDPVLYACQKNFILGIGDVFSHRDASVPGSGLSSPLEGGTLATVNADDLSSTPANDDRPDGLMKNVMHSTDMIGKLEGFPGSFSTQWNNCGGGGRGNTNFMGGMAYDMHVRDIRPDLAGFQSISTYWLDVQEDSTYCHKNQFWLAAKYGGFAPPKGSFTPYASSNSPTTLSDDRWASRDSLPFPGTSFQPSNSFSTDSGSTDKRPTNYFPGNSPQTMKTGLTKAFAKIATEASEATVTALASPSPQQKASGGANYAASYDPANWTGSLKGQTVTYDANGKPTLSDAWDAGVILDARNWTTRRIITSCNGRGAVFDQSLACSASFAAVDGVSSQSAANYINYLRGDTTQEIDNGGVYRNRTSLLGDIVNAKVVAVAAPDKSLDDRHNPGYSDFSRRYAKRDTVVYVGANDGMLHAFNGSVSSADGGKELFAYVPGLIYSDSDPNTAGGLSSLGNPAFTHRYLVDATPNVFDIDFQRAGSPGTGGTASDWRSVLIGGLGKGGKGYYAIDVTDPASWTSDSAMASKVLWEFGNGNGASSTTHMGYSYGDALVVRTAKYGWVVVLTSGYNNDDGKGYFFFVNPRTGALLETVTTPEGSTSSPLNLAKASAFVPSYKDGSADAIYAGDLQGNVWRLDLTPSSGNYAAPTKIAVLKDAHGTAQPITTRPLIEIEPTSSKRYVLIGTGRLLADSDAANASVQSFYAIIDGSGKAGDFFGGTKSLPGGISFPITRGELEENRSLVAGIGSSPARTMGWYFDMQVQMNVAERVNIDPTVNKGIVAWAGTRPGGAICSPSGTSMIYAASIGLGKSRLIDASGSAVASLAQASSVTDIAFVNVRGSVHLLGGTSAGTVTKVPGQFAASIAMKRLNWRVVPMVD